jgi:hypothetical protein
MHARHNRGHDSRQYFLSRQTLIITQNYTLSALEVSRSLKTFKTSTNQYLVSNEYFYMVNEIKNVSKMVDISLLQVKRFQELSKIWKIGKRS